MSTSPHKLLLFPHSAPSGREIAALAPWLGSLSVLRPPALPDAAFDQTLLQAGLVTLLSPGGKDGTGGTGDDQGHALQRMLTQWEGWIRDQQGTGRVEALKAGIKPPPPTESILSLAQRIKNFGKEPAGQGPPPEAGAGLLLHLAFVEDLRTTESDRLMAQTEAAQAGLGEILGVDDGLDQVPAQVPPPEYRREMQKQLPARLAAWAALAGGLIGPDTLMATSLDAARLLAQRCNQAADPAPGGGRSRAGASRILPGPGEPSGGPAGELAGLSLPAPVGADSAAMANYCAALAADPGTGPVRQAWLELLGKLRGAAPRDELRQQLSPLAQKVEGLSRELAAKTGAALTQVQVSLFGFSGLDQGGMLALMHDKAPAANDAGGSWPLLALAGA